MRKLATYICWILALSVLGLAQTPQAVYQKSRNAKSSMSGGAADQAPQRSHSTMARGSAKVTQKIKAQAEVADATSGAKAATPRGRRDPFVSPIKMVEDSMKSSAACSTGARCLLIDQIQLKGVVKTTSGMIAMVENAARKQYNLRENDPVFNGFVLKITGDSIVFRQNATDALGKPSTKEVVKRVTVPVV